MTRAIILISGLLFLWTACDSPTDSGDENGGPAQASLSFVVSDNTGLTKGLSGHVQVDTAKVLIRTIQFHSSDDSDSLNYRTDSFVLNLDMSGGLNTIEAMDIPAGSYNKVSFRVHKPGSGEDVGDDDFYESDSGADRYSVVVKGTYLNSAFTFKSRSTPQQKIKFDPDLVVTDTTTFVNVTLSVDVMSWFVDKNGDNLDPTNEDDESDIDGAIKDSFKGFMDNDKNGRGGD